MFRPEKLQPNGVEKNSSSPKSKLPRKNIFEELLAMKYANDEDFEM